jgi:hypothetical protein
MRKTVVGIAGVFLLLFAGILAWNAEAAAAIGAATIHPGMNNSLVEKAGCGEKEKDICETGSMLVCSKGADPKSPDCKCDTCPPGGAHGGGCPCPGRVCNFLGQWYDCR